MAFTSNPQIVPNTCTTPVAPDEKCGHEAILVTSDQFTDSERPEARCAGCATWLGEVYGDRTVKFNGQIAR